MILLIGGHGDGEWVPDRGKSTFPRLVRSIVVKRYDTFGPEGAGPVQTEIENYVRQSWEDHSVDPPVMLPIYVHESLTLSGALLRLMAFYRPKGS